MAAADIDIGVGPTIAGRVQARFGLFGLFILLAAFTLFTLDGGDIAPRVISAIFLVLAALFLSIPFSQRLSVSVPVVCLLLMAIWGAGQTLFSSQKIIYNGWTGVLFWFTAAVIALVGTQVFKTPRAAAEFRLAFIVFGSAIALLDLLEQASRASKYYWFIPSRYHAVFGPFSYWNNFAQFIELVLPITLWQGLARRQPSVVYLLLGALQICSVVASGSRAGTFLVLAEMIVLMGLAYGRYKNRKFLMGAGLALVLSVAFIYAAGFDTLIGKLQQSDQLAVRRNINQSSWAMIRERPLTGWGLETYVPVYRMFALYDDGTYVNRAHNDWLQWAAEGGIPFALLMLILFFWSIPPAIRSGWGVGLIAICLHASVDYPFARLGVCGWYFALVTMLAYQQAEVREKPYRPEKDRRQQDENAPMEDFI